MEVEVTNTVGAKIGDRIVLYFETSSLLKAAFLLYIFRRQRGRSQKPKFFLRNTVDHIHDMTYIYHILLLSESS